MPNTKIHSLCSNIIFGKPYKEVHAFFDLGQYICPLAIHRLLPPHTPCSAILYSIYKSDSSIIYIYIQHIIQDTLQIIFFPISVCLDFILLILIKIFNVSRKTILKY